jgi:hypothetical protein
MSSQYEWMIEQIAEQMAVNEYGVGLLDLSTEQQGLIYDKAMQQFLRG